MTEPKLIISLGGAHQSRIVAVKEWTWSQYVRYLVDKVPETTDKASRGWSIPAKFDPVYRDSDNFVARYALTFDYDHITEDDLVRIREAYKLHEYVEYTTWSHSDFEEPRYRFLFPLRRAVTYDEFQAISRRVASWAGIELTSRETHVPAQMMYLPTIKPRTKFHYALHTAAWLNPDTILESYTDWTNREEWPKLREGDGVQAHGKAEDPREKKGIIGAFCRAFSIEDAIEKFQLPYEKVR